MWVIGNTAPHKRMRARVGGLVKVIKRWKAEGKIGKDEQKRLDYLFRRLTEILRQDAADTAKAEKEEHWVEPVPDADCEFYDIDQNRIQCAIGCDMYHCGKTCKYATDQPMSLPPYGTKYLKGQL